ncbi:TetR/AcrR family transcriptional regulator [Bacillus swezeyi]|uniref:TetR family transcriptional regulator n=1 Tax=Bacillus swezeyi TaxID=1925020 RepID=A0A1R1S2V3_9BACI|nr:TetR/AcrR family transcriptional regulator [Bacillus swezeyi]MEC1261919.1 TetR/AcrR family transcriptional regulator [Bacillus swezeyi]MED2930308.1 TetR/AcrR family transcriptional regulator [Bacillus swezeyi]MED2966219.1 TetR/AcrR family transcriptional regulator [Bacillus swezeyi]MED2976790.1 TetR/AcrR family transcriptional regulator [Bacillus swezeyi]MED3072747.1 TetR/AcrR family transcriptional regulator [Bacillus swezeyi]
MARPNVTSKEMLIEAAKRRIAERGLENLTLKAVAEDANVTQGTVYYHFRTKEQLVFEVVRDVCCTSWESLRANQKPAAEKMKDGLASAKARTQEGAYYHQLFLELVVFGFRNERINKQLGELLDDENTFLADQLSGLWKRSPVEGVSLKTWSILLNALIDGLALQSFISSEFSSDEIYQELELVLQKLTEDALKQHEKADQ